MRLLTRLCLMAFVVLAALAPGAAGASAPATPVAEAWYPSGVGQVAALVYPNDTLHVGMAAGQESDRTYLRFDLPSRPEEAVLDGVTVTIPIAADAGTLAAENAVIRACAVPGGFEEEGDASPPEVDCEAGVDAVFAEGETPTFTVEVGSLVKGDTVDLAFVPDGGDTWHVGFDSRSREGGNPPTVRVTYSSRVTPTTDTDSTFADPPNHPADFPNQPTLGLPSLPEPTPTPGRASTGGAIADRAQLSRPSALTSTPVRDGRFRYTAIFGLPLALLIAVAVSGDGLTRPVRLRREPS